MAEYVIRVVIDASAARPAIANVSKGVEKVETGGARAAKSVKKIKTEAELAAAQIAKISLSRGFARLESSSERTARVLRQVNDEAAAAARQIAKLGLEKGSRRLETSGERAAKAFAQAKTEAQGAAAAIAKMSLAANNMMSVRGSLADTLRAGRVQAQGFNTELQKTMTAAKAALVVQDKGLERQLKQSQIEAQKLAANLVRVSKAAQDSLAAARGGGLDAALRATAGDVSGFLKQRKAGPQGPSKDDRKWATSIYENALGSRSQNALMARTAVGANLSKTQKDAEALAKSLNKAAKAGDDLGSSIGRIAAVAAATTIGALVAGVIHLSDEYTVLQNKLKTVTDGEEELNQKTEETFALAQRLRTEWAATAQVYGRIQRSTEELGLSEDQVMKITENLSKAIKVSGATANETKSVLLQLGQAFGSGKLNGDEFRSVMENATEVGNVLAASLGVTRGELKALSSAGRITSAVLAKAFLSNHKVFSEFSEAIPTFAERFEMMRNAAIKAVGEWAKQSSLVSAFGKAIEFATNHIDVFLRVAASLGVLLTGALVAYAIPKAIAAFHALTAAMAANPWIAAATAISVLAVAFSDLSSDMQQVKDLKQMGITIAAGFEQLVVNSDAYKRVVTEAEAASARFKAAITAVFDEIAHGKSLFGQLEKQIQGAFSGVDVFKSIQKLQLDTAPALIEAVTASTLKNVDRLVQKQKEARQAYEALKRDLETLASSMDPVTAQTLEWNEAEKTLDRALRAKLITLEEQKKLLDATYDTIFDAPRAAEATFAAGEELAKTAIAREDLLVQMADEQRAVERSNKLYSEMSGRQRDYVEAVNAANIALAEGRIAWDDYTEALEDAQLALLAAEKGSKSLEYGIASGWDRMLDQATDVAGAVETAFVNAYSSIEDALIDLVVTGQTNFKKLVDSMLADVTRILVRLAITSFIAGDYEKSAVAAGAVGAGGLLSALGGLRTGGQFSVGGTGGPDSQVVAFRATPGERVSVTTPAQSAKGNFGGGQQPVVIYNVYDQREVSALDTPAGSRAINNVLRKNPQIVRSRNR